MRSWFPIFWHNVFPILRFLTLNLVLLRFTRMGCRPWRSLWDSQVEEPPSAKVFAQHVSHPPNVQNTVTSPMRVLPLSVLSSGARFRASLSLVHSWLQIFPFSLWSLLISRTLTSSKEIYFKIFWRVVSLLTLKGPHPIIRSWVKTNKQTENI